MYVLVCIEMSNLIFGWFIDSTTTVAVRTLAYLAKVRHYLCPQQFLYLYKAQDLSCLEHSCNFWVGAVTCNLKVFTFMEKCANHLVRF